MTNLKTVWRQILYIGVFDHLNRQEMPNCKHFKRNCGAKFYALVFLITHSMLICVFVTTFEADVMANNCNTPFHIDHAV